MRKVASGRRFSTDYDRDDIANVYPALQGEHLTEEFPPEDDADIQAALGLPER